MSFFKDFKEDLSQAVNELMPDESDAVEEAFSGNGAEPSFTEPMIDTQAVSDIMAGSDSSFNSDELADMLKTIDEVKTDIPEPDIQPMPQAAIPTPAAAPGSAGFGGSAVSGSAGFGGSASAGAAGFGSAAAGSSVTAQAPVPDIAISGGTSPFATAPSQNSTVDPVFSPEPVIPEDQKLTAAPVFGEPDVVKSEPINTVKNLKTMEVGIIISGMAVNGDVKADGSLEVRGSVKGNIEIEGRLEITGTVEGNSVAEEVFADGAKVVGDIKCNGSVKIGPSSVVRGNLTATAAVIAGAVKGDIDIQGPVILDSTAIIMGNIKSKSIQINNGATIEGLCSQCYGDVSPLSFFGEDKVEKPAAKATKASK